MPVANCSNKDPERVKLGHGLEANLAKQHEIREMEFGMMTLSVRSGSPGFDFQHASSFPSSSYILPDLCASSVIGEKHKI